MIAHVRRLTRGEAATHGSRNCFLNDRMAQRPAYWYTYFRVAQRTGR
jgi:hypothetical protein